MSKLELYRREVERCWEDGILTIEEYMFLEQLREQFGITPAENSAIHTEIQNKLIKDKTRSGGTEFYKSLLKIALADGKISTEEDIMLTKLRYQYNIEEAEHEKLKRAVIDELILEGKTSRAEIKIYADAVRGVIEDGIVTTEELEFLNKLRKEIRLALPQARAIELKLTEERASLERKTPAKLRLRRYQLLGKEALRTGKYELAIRYFDKALELYPNSPELWCQKAVAVAKLGNYEKALNYAKHAVRLNPKFSIAREICFYCLSLIRNKIDKVEAKLKTKL